MVQRLSRQQLYDLVWSEPMQKLAPQFGISDVALKKACARWQIPVPERGYWARRQAGKKTLQPALLPRPPGLNEEVVVGGGGSYWNHGLSNEEILGPLPPPPEFAEPIEAVRGRVRQQIGRVVFPKIANTRHPLIARLLDDDEKRREKQKASRYFSTWDAPLFDSPSEQRRLRILNALFFAVAKAGGKPSTRGSEAREITMTVGHHHVGIVLDAPGNRGHPRRNGSPDATVDKRIRLAILLALGTEKERAAWQDDTNGKLEDKLDEIAVEVVVNAEVQYRESSARSYQWRVERKAQLEEEVRRQKVEAERRERARLVKLEQHRVDRLLGEADALRKANDIRAYVQAVIEANGASSNPVPADEMQQWSAWALSQASRIDPVASGVFRRLGGDDVEVHDDE